jgi:photosystem II biogenesis protein Psp29
VTVADTKDRFIRAYPYPIPSVWSVAVQELLVTQHFVRYSTKYSYSKISSLGFVSVFDQLFEGFPSDEEKEKIFKSFVEALSEDPVAVRADAAALAVFAEGAGSVDGIAANELFAATKALNEAKKFAYSRYDAVGLFRMLELAGAAEPSALETLANASGIPLKKINGDLGMYKMLLSRMAAAKELSAEIYEREKRKDAERMAKKVEKAAAAEKEA